MPCERLTFESWSAQFCFLLGFGLEVWLGANIELIRAEVMKFFGAVHVSHCLCTVYLIFSPAVCPDFQQQGLQHYFLADSHSTKLRTLGLAVRHSHPIFLEYSTIASYLTVLVEGAHSYLGL
jgi:hypothetical protein